MKIHFEYKNQTVETNWRPITLTLEIDPDHIDSKLESLKRQFPGCSIRALDENCLVLAITHP